MGDSDFKLTQIGVIMLGVPALERSVPFYRDKLGLSLKGQVEGFAFLDAGAVTLCLSESLAKASTQIAGAVEVVFSVADVRGTHRALAARGVEFSRGPFHATGAMWAANFRDPDGHILSIFGPEESAPDLVQ